MIETEVIAKEEYSRFKDMNWFQNIYKKDILVIGSGGIGSWTNMLLARCGASLHIFDNDIYEAHNKSGQLVRHQDIGKTKVNAISEIIGEFCDSDVEVTTYNEKYTKDSITNNIVIMGVDNMEARKIGFENWNQYLIDNPDERINSIFIDGRLSATSLQIFCLRGTAVENIVNYRDNYLFDDSEVEELPCAQKQTSHIACMIASHIVGFLTSFLSPDNYNVPFFYEYIIPINFTETKD